jgi:hypothetical protein
VIALVLAAAAGQAQLPPAPGPAPQSLLVVPPPVAPLPAGPDLAPLVPPALEYALSLQQNEWRVNVALRPGEPQPGRVVELRFDIGRQQNGAGEPAPWSGGSLQLIVSGPGPRLRYLVHALGDAGVYGVHWTPSARGVWTLTLSPYQQGRSQASPGDGPEPKAEALAAAGPNVTLQVGAGEPMPASTQGHMVQISRTVVGEVKREEPSLRQIMQELGRRWRNEEESARPDAAELRAMARLMRATAGKAPRDVAGDAQQFDKLVAKVAGQLDAGRLPQPQACLECHLKYRDGWVADISRFPEVHR